MAASGGGLPSPATVVGFSTQAPARARFPGRPCSARSRLRSEKRTRRGRLGSEDGELAAGGPRPVNIGLALSEDPALLRLLGVTEKHRRQKDAGFDSSDSEEKDFTGFGTKAVCPQKTSGTVPQSSTLSQRKSPQILDHPPAAKHLIGKIISKSPKPALIGKIVPRVLKEGQGGKKGTAEVKQEAPSDEDKQVTDRQSTMRAADLIGKVTEAADLGSMQNQTATTSAGGTRQDKVLSALAAVKGTEKASKVKAGSEVSGDSDTDQCQPQRSLKQMGGVRIAHSRRTSRAVTLSFISIHKRQRKRLAKGMGASPEAGAEAGAQSGEEAAMPLERKATDSPEKRPYRRHQRKSLYGHRRKPSKNTHPKAGRIRTKRVYYTYVPEPIPATLTQDGNKQQLQGQNITLAGDVINQSSENSSTPVTSGRSSRVIKTPKRFLGEDMIPFPKGSLSTWLKSQQREDGKPSTSLNESDYDGNSLQLDNDSVSAFDSPSAETKFSQNPSSGTSHLEIYKNLKKLTLNLAEKTKGQSESQVDTHQADRLASHGRKRRRSKLMMEELDSPGVVRKLAVVVGTDAEAPSHMPTEDIDEAGSVTGDSQETLEVSGPSHRIGLSGANKRMLHLLKKAKVQLIKIDQQKQLKLSQVGSNFTFYLEGYVPVSGRRRRRVGYFCVCVQEQPVGGPRIKHVCRAAAVALGQPRAMVPDDIPRLSALPLHEREGLTFTPAAEGTHSEFKMTRSKEIKSSNRCILSRYAPGGVRSRRCGRCKGCLIEEDCAKCVNCLDKPKFGGPNTKRQSKYLSFSLRNITPRSYSSLLKSESEEEEEEGLGGGGEDEKKDITDTSSVKIKEATDPIPHTVCFFYRVYQEEGAVQNVWLMGGLSVLTSVPTTPQPVCLLCASKGRYEMIFCQICCEPFHSFCLSLEERPQAEYKENWCCRRCKFCHVCGRRNKSTKPVLQCRRCQTSYHPSCLGPTYPKPMNCGMPWVCMTCIRCKSCGVTPGKTWDMAWNHEQDLCPDCTSLHNKGNFCTFIIIGHVTKAFHVDVVSVMRKWLQEEEIVPEDQRATSQARFDLDLTYVFWLPSHSLKKWSSFSEEFPSGMLPEAVLPPSKEHSYAQWLERTYQSKESRDVRQCALCQQYGDSAPSDAGRLLYLGQNEWAHVNCCLWSAEVYEENSALLQVHSAVSRGRHLRCDRCGQSGATVGCCLATCQGNFHFMCARAQNCVFQKDRKMYCCNHRDLVSAKVVSGKGFEVSRRVYVDFEGINFRRKFLTGLEPESINLTIGSLQIQKLGVLSELSSNGRMLYPVGYQCSRLYWSTVDPRRRCKYTCKVTEVSTPLPGEEQDPSWDQEENHTIVHSPNHHRGDSSSSPVKSTTPSPNSKQHNTPGSKSPGYTQTRRPAGGSSRPLPSPGSAPPKSHHVLTLRDLDDTRRPRRVSSRSRCSSSPTDSDPSAPMTLRSGGTVHSRCALFGSPPRSSSFGPASPPLSRQNSTSPVWSSPPRSSSSISSGLSPRQLAMTHSPRGKHNFKITTPVSAEVPQDFLASSEAEDAAVATTNGISLAPDNLEEEVADLMAQELPYTVFDTDTEAVFDTDTDAVASMLNAKLEFDETLLTENVVLHCGAQSGRTEVEGSVPNVEMQDVSKENDSEDEDSRHYLKFSRTVVCDAAGGSDAAGQLPSAQSISQLDGADSGSESDEGEPVNETERKDGETKIHTNHNTPTKQLTVALKRLESIYTVSKSTFEPAKSEPEVQENPSVSALLESGSALDDMSVEEEEVQVSSEIPASHNEVFLDSATGHFISAEDGSVVSAKNNEADDKDDSSSSADSVGGFKDDLNDPDYSPEAKTKKSPITQMKTIFVNTKRPTSNLKSLSPKSCIQQQHKLKLLLPPRPVQVVNAASVSSTVTSPIVINGLNALPVRPGATRGKAIAIRLDNYRPGSQAQNEAVAANSPQESAPSPQVLLVNRQGHILIKDPRSNTYQSFSTNSPAYGKISQIAKILHRPSTLQRSFHNIIIKPGSDPSATNGPPASNHTSSSERKIIVRVLPLKTSGTTTPTASVSVQSVPEPGFTNIEESTAQAIIDRAMATHRDMQKTTPIILGNTRHSESASGFLHKPDVNLLPTTASSRPQVRVKRVSSVTEKSSRKKSKMDFLRDPSNVIVLTFIVNIYLSFLPRPSQVESPSKSTQHNSLCKSKTHMWVSARHGELSEWGPYSGFSSDEDAPAPKHKKRTYMNQPHLRFEITSDDGFSVKANSIEVAWRAVIDGVLEARAGFHLKQLPLGGMSGPWVLGVVHDAVIFLLEQLQGAANCKHHRFRFHRCDDIEEELPLNPSGCARAEVYTRKATFDMFNFLASQHRVLPDIIGPFDEEEDEFPLKSSRRATSSELPMAMRFRHLEKLSKEAVGVYRSQIHGRGLFCKRNIEAGEMVIEYAGTVIRAVLTDKREKYYDSKGIGCYMFRIDDFDVVDATMQGNAARFINHSCEPNCYSRVINVDGRKHIVIFALRKIYRGEELTYDYKFPIEDENNKLHCNCGARRCRRFLN
uniref:[histone H3]-lysine(4) N-methyltransferase n=1 Tax=Mastacembelus armatus TaxID=205130 RepID=A0A3Q3MGY6_9TELE